MSAFNLNEQNSNLDYKIVAGMERLSQIFRALLWNQAKRYNLSPIQLQILIFIHYHDAEKNTISYLAREFNVTKSTISDAVKSLALKSLIKKAGNESDGRSYSLQLTAEGESTVNRTEGFAEPFCRIIGQQTGPDKEFLWAHISGLIRALQAQGIISVQRTCYNCKHHCIKNGSDYCNLLNQKLLVKDIRIDCGEFEPAV